jgi:hypothetical protein
MTVTLSILTAETPAGAVEWARLFSYQLPAGHDPGVPAVLESLTAGRRRPGHLYRWTDYRVPIELVPARLLDTEHEADLDHGRITGFSGVDLLPVLAGRATARAELREPGACEPATPGTPLSPAA